MRQIQIHSDAGEFGQPERTEFRKIDKRKSKGGVYVPTNASSSVCMLRCGSCLRSGSIEYSNSRLRYPRRLYSSNNNWFTTHSTNGNVQWTDGAISFTDSVTSALRVGIQLHIYELGELGGPQIDVDWVSGDYRVTPWLGIRAGKIKTRIGLFNDTQDVDAVHLWALLPESMYQTDNKSFLLAHFGFDVYGTMNLGERAENSCIRVRRLSRFGPAWRIYQ